MDYNVDVIKIGTNSKSGPRDPNCLTKVVGTVLTKADMRWKTVSPFT